MNIDINGRNDGKYCVSFQKEGGNKNNVYITEEELMVLADKSSLAAEAALESRKRGIAETIAESARKARQKHRDHKVSFNVPIVFGYCTRIDF